MTRFIGEAGGRQHTRLLLAAALSSLLLAGCASRPTLPSLPSVADGPLPDPPPRLAELPDATPRIEPIRPGGPNKPYEVLGERYQPLQLDTPFSERGLASWYGRKFHGRPTASGEVYNMFAMTAAHPTLPIPSYARIRNPANGREVVVRINDRGPFHKGRIVDLSYTAALKLDLLRGVAPVELARITHAEIRARLGRPAEVPLLAPAEAAEVATRGTPAGRTGTPTARGFWAQLGAFRSLDGAEALRRRLIEEDLGRAPVLAIFREGGLHRLQAGPYASREEAKGQWREAGVVERR
jgi:rare lipoprotein A